MDLKDISFILGLVVGVVLCICFSFKNILPNEIDVAQEMCANNGGIEKITAEILGRNKFICVNGLSGEIERD